MQFLDLNSQLELASNRRTHRVFLRLLYMGIALAGFYSLLYFYTGATMLGAIIAAVMLSFGGFLYLEKRGKEVIARMGYTYVCSIAMVFSELQFNGSTFTRLFFLPVICLTYFLFRGHERKIKVLAMGFPLLIWLGLESFTVFSKNHFGTDPIFLSKHTIHILRSLTILTSCAMTFIIFYVVQRESKLFEDQLQNSFGNLRRAQNLLVYQAKMAAVGEMAAEIAHEINNPLEIIRSRLMAKAPDEVDQKIMVMTDRIAAIIKGLRLSVRASHDEDMVNYPIREIVSDAVELAKMRYLKMGVTLDYPGIAPGKNVRCRPVELVQVMIALLNNALDAVKDASEKWVRLSLKENETEIEIHIADSGAGVPKELREEIFKAFFTTKPPESGTGLGLSISRNIMEQHRGKLVLADGVPTTFIVKLPR